MKVYKVIKPHKSHNDFYVVFCIHKSSTVIDMLCKMWYYLCIKLIV